ncbi:hypothetical protein [Bacillus sp. B15-48]|uniref:hypothetical protein n=1 Tax=Bacillus sp. B15-48 TaxID=1548601 RepID=UPI00193FD165|nr:hypothetical protein [Bacillus sp. B15-48]MBM4762117.1 hypothetical protein [Bacillus sp. B15-48]
MDYIIDNAHILKTGSIKNISLLIENNHISSLRSSFNWYKHLRVNAANYIMTPTHVLFDANLPFSGTFVQRKDYYLKQFILKGCTTILTCTSVRKEKELTLQLKKIKSQMLDCPVDYVIGIKVPTKLLTASFLRKCKRERMPAIFVEVNHAAELEEVKWGWVKEALFPYNSPLIPIFSNDDKFTHSLWKEIMKTHRIPSLEDEIIADVPLNRKTLEKIGIFPKKSNLQDGGELSYNFYSKDKETVKMKESELFMKHESSLLMTIHKGKVIRAGKYMNYRPGYGEYVLIKTPSFYLSPT